MQAVADAWEVRLEALQSSSRVRSLSEARSAVAYLVAEYGADTLISLGKLLRRDVSTLSTGAQVIRSALPNDSVLRGRIQVALSNARTKQNNKTAKA